MPIHTLGIVKNGDKHEIPIISALPREMTMAEFALLSDAEKMGDIIVTDYPVNEESDYVEVIGDGVKTFGTLLTELFALVDASKLTRSSSIVKVNPNGAKVIHTIALDYTSLSTPYLNFCSVGFTGGLDPDNDYIRLSATPQYGNAGFNARTNLTNNIATEGTKFILYYNDAHTFDFNTKAENCIFDPTGTSLSSTNAEDAIKEVEGNVLADGSHTTYGIFSNISSLGAYRLFVPYPNATSKNITLTQVLLFDSGYNTIDITADSSIYKVDTGFSIETSNNNASNKFTEVKFTVS